ncbi:MAG: hypothetical protein PHZ11_06785 [Desulfitobacteriaceae bacterium]|nr:hypothetical protein [Desulfitobacteriaceae bacterium]
MSSKVLEVTGNIVSAAINSSANFTDEVYRQGTIDFIQAVYEKVKELEVKEKENKEKYKEEKKNQEKYKEEIEYKEKD